MCGVFGIYNFDIQNLERARCALHTLEHRGPDQYGEFSSKGIYLGHKRLSIIDLSEKGKQPMTDDEKNVTISVNGEIYNFLALKNDLIKKYHFKSNSDSEVLLYGYIEWGIKTLLDKIDGMYALLIYDNNIKTLYAVRDKFGKKPLYYYPFGKEIILSSEIKAIFKYDENSKVFSKKGLFDWLYNRGNISGITIYDNVRKVSPGSYLAISNEGISVTKYYNIFERVKFINNDKFENTIEELEKRLDIAVSKRLISDVPVGLQLSGGIDSSLIAYFLRKHHNGALHSFSIGFEDITEERFSEEKYAKFVAQKLSLVHHQINISQKDVLDEFENVLYLTDGMMDIPNTIPIYILSKYAKKYITVALTGEGADEAFGGYTKLNLPLSLVLKKKEPAVSPSVLIELLGRVKYSKIRNFARHLYLKKKYSGKTKDIINDINCYISPEALSNIFYGCNNIEKITDIYSDIYNSNFDVQKKFLLYEVMFYLFSLLERQDRASMGAAIESRLPFLDPLIIEWSLNLSNDLLFNENNNKILLKKLSERIFGKEFTYREKLGFPLPIHKWLDDKNGFGNYVSKIYDKNSVLGEIFNREKLKKYLYSKKLGNKLLAYGDSDKIWIKWFLMVLRTAEIKFGISNIK